MLRRLTHIENPPFPLPLESRKTRGERKGAAAMKQQAIQYVAFDVHQATTVTSLRDQSGSVVMRATVARAILQLVKSAGAPGSRGLRGGNTSSVASRSADPGG